MVICRTSIVDEGRQVRLADFPRKRRPTNWGNKAYMVICRTSIVEGVLELFAGIGGV
ncbi:hypothetical protein [Fundicoccus culcitae]|uniref:Uncharacterized protein n=1 Tax=Fundicoccus culcitae TaxID=2969821 RepID=A0ABY5P9Z3_9LACT|nr:hypothetical protein [Fundicoccus culcitae]UUX35190.1 hypothetical protein NRE15_05985 [Fundicoccus culcitae]